MLSRNYHRNLRIWASNFGRDYGWYLECGGKPIALLTEPRYEEMFWDSYRMEILTDNLDLQRSLLTEEFWSHAESEDLSWRSREFATVIEGVFPASSPFPEHGRLTVRGLHIPIPEPNIWDKFILWLHRSKYKSG